MSLVEKLSTAIDTLTFGEKLLGSLQVALFGMLIVFLVLILIMFAIILLKKFAGDTQKAPTLSISREETTMDGKESKEAMEDYGELVAVITASIAASLNISTHRIVIKNIIRSVDTTPAWSKAGRLDQLNKR